EEWVEGEGGEGGFEVVEQIEGCRAGKEHGEKEPEGGKGTFAARQQRQAPHVLARRARVDLDAGVEDVVGVGEGDATGSAGEQGREQGREVLADVIESGLEHGDDLTVDRAGDGQEGAPALRHVYEL